MSFTLTQLAWSISLSCGPKMVLLALCHCENEKHGCFPSVPTIAKWCGMGERSVQRYLTVLVEQSLVKQQFRDGKSTIFSLNLADSPDPSQGYTPATQSPHPRQGVTPPPPHSHPTPATQSPITVNLTSNLTKGVKNYSEFDPLTYLMELDVEEQTALDWISLRKAKRCPATKTAIDDLLRKFLKSKISYQQGLTLCCSRGWAGFEIAWMKNEERRQTADDKRQAWLDELTGKTHEQNSNIIDITDLAGASVTTRAY